MDICGWLLQYTESGCSLPRWRQETTQRVQSGGTWLCRPAQPGIASTTEWRNMVFDLVTYNAVFDQFIPLFWGRGHLKQFLHRFLANWFLLPLLQWFWPAWFGSDCTGGWNGQKSFSKEQQLGGPEPDTEAGLLLKNQLRALLLCPIHLDINKVLFYLTKIKVLYAAMDAAVATHIFLALVDHKLSSLPQRQPQQGEDHWRCATSMCQGIVDVGFSGKPARNRAVSGQSSACSMLYSLLSTASWEVFHISLVVLLDRWHRSIQARNIREARGQGICGPSETPVS